MLRGVFLYLKYRGKEGCNAVYQLAEFGCMPQTVGRKLAAAGKFFDELFFYIIDKKW